MSAFQKRTPTPSKSWRWAESPWILLAVGAVLVLVAATLVSRWSPLRLGGPLGLGSWRGGTADDTGAGTEGNSLFPPPGEKRIRRESARESLAPAFGIARQAVPLVGALIHLDKGTVRPAGASDSAGSAAAVLKEFHLGGREQVGPDGEDPWQRVELEARGITPSPADAQAEPKAEASAGLRPPRSRVCVVYAASREQMAHLLSTLSMLAENLPEEDCLDF